MADPPTIQVLCLNMRYLSLLFVSETTCRWMETFDEAHISLQPNGPMAMALMLADEAYSRGLERMAKVPMPRAILNGRQLNASRSTTVVYAASGSVIIGQRGGLEAHRHP